MSRARQLRKAVRPALKARALLSGPTGAGKTRTALIMAEVLAQGDPIAFIDTEKESALTYADDFDFDHMPWQPPFDVPELAATITDVAHDYGVVICDSMSHFWRGQGGTLDVAGGKYTGWKEARPMQEALIEAILRSDAHFIGCARAKMEYAQELENGRHVVRKLGMGVKQDDDLEYEMNVAWEMSLQHDLLTSKSRTTAIPVGRIYRGDQAGELAETYRAWLAGGDPPADEKLIDGLKQRINRLPEDLRKQCKGQFMAALGPPDRLLDGQLAAADELVREYEQANESRPVVGAEQADPEAPTSPPPGRAEPLSVPLYDPDENCGICHADYGGPRTGTDVTFPDGTPAQWVHTACRDEYLPDPAERDEEPY